MLYRGFLSVYHGTIPFRRSRSLKWLSCRSRKTSRHQRYHCVHCLLRGTSQSQLQYLNPGWYFCTRSSRRVLKLLIRDASMSLWRFGRSNGCAGSSKALFPLRLSNRDFGFGRPEVTWWRCQLPSFWICWTQLLALLPRFFFLDAEHVGLVLRIVIAKLFHVLLASGMAFRWHKLFSQAMIHKAE